ncbi:FkbM family methyltransferase [Alienimonas sp. DA493]
MLLRRDLADFRGDRAFFRELLAPGDLCFDVGANAGAKAEALCAAGARVVAFEPQAELADEIRARCRGYGGQLLDVRTAAVGSEVGRMTLTVGRPGSVTASLRPEKEQGNAADRDRLSREVPVTTLETEIERFGVPVYCKIDVEGWERETLAGLARPVRFLSFEYHRTDTAVAVGCLERLAELGATDAAFSSPRPFRLTTGWTPLPEFRSRFENAVADGPPYGEVFVRTGTD